MILEKPLIDNLDLVARNVVEGFIIGLHRSPFHGFSVEFAEHRLYNPGDPIKHIDWKVYGRTDKLFLKRYEEETNLRCCVMIDTSASMNFPEKGKTLSKLQFSIVASAALLHLLKRQLDAACLALFDEEVYYRSACRSASTHYKILIEQLQKCLQAPPSKATNATAALHSIAEQMHRRSLVVIFSDMVDGSTDTDELFAALQHLKYNKHEVILFHVMDGEQELDFNFENRPYEFIDMETGDKIKLLPQQLKEEYSKQVSAFHASIRQKCLQYHIDFIPVNLRQPVEEVLRSFLLKRQRMGGNG